MQPTGKKDFTKQRKKAYIDEIEYTLVVGLVNISGHEV